MESENCPYKQDFGENGTTKTHIEDAKSQMETGFRKYFKII